MLFSHYFKCSNSNVKNIWKSKMAADSDVIYVAVVAMETN